MLRSHVGIEMKVVRRLIVVHLVVVHHMTGPETRETGVVTAFLVKAALPDTYQRSFIRVGCLFEVERARRSSVLLSLLEFSRFGFYGSK